MSPIVKRAFVEWMKISTWYSGHPQDQARFHRFVWTSIRFSRRPVTGQDVRQGIINAWAGRLDDEFLKARVMEYASLYEELCDFAAAKNAKRLFLIDTDGNPIL
jgi:hypothetical protein